VSCFPIDPAVSRVETITGALLYLMTAYQRTHCPRIATVIVRHLESLAFHPSADPVVRDVCEALRAEWHSISEGATCSARNRALH
jgi:hypothetical protein